MSEETKGKELKEKLFNKKENGWFNVDSEKEKVIINKDIICFNFTKLIYFTSIHS